MQTTPAKRQSQSALQVKPPTMNPLVPRDAEQSVLGACLKFPECLDTARGILPGPPAFGSPKHRTIYEAMLRIADNNRRADNTSVIEELRSSGELDRIGGRVYLVELIEDTVTSAQLAQHCEIVREAFRLRSFEQIADRLKSAVATPGAESAEIEEELDRQLTALDDGRAADLVRMDEGAVRYIDEILAGRPPVRKQDRVLTRIADLNTFLGGGLFRGDVVVVGGPPSMGKSSLVIDLLLFAASVDQSSIYYCPDETVRAIEERVIINFAGGLTRERLVSGNLRPDELRMLQEAKRRIEYLPGKPWVIGSSSLTAADIVSTTRRQHRKHPLAIVAIDYLTLIRAPRYMQNARFTETQIVSENSRQFKALAKDLNVLVVVVSQLNREYIKGPFDPDKNLWGIPTQSNLRQSGDVESEANVILFGVRPLKMLQDRGIPPEHKWYDAIRTKQKELNLPEHVEPAFIHVAKNKMSRTGAVSCVFDQLRMQWYNIATEELPF